MLLNQIDLPNSPLKINYISDSKEYGILFAGYDEDRVQSFKVMSESGSQIKIFDFYGNDGFAPQYSDFTINSKGEYAVFISRWKGEMLHVSLPDSSKRKVNTAKFYSVFISPDNSDVYVSSSGGGRDIFVYDRWATRNKENLYSSHGDSVNSMLVFDNGKTIYTGGDDKVVRVAYEREDGQHEEGVYEGVSSSVMDITLSNERGLLAAVSGEGVVSIWDIKSRKKLSNVVYSSERKQLLSYTDKGYYKGDRDSMSLIAFKYKDRGYRFSQFDHIVNRPDIVLKKLPGYNQILVTALKQAYQKRLVLNEITEVSAIDFEGIPVVSILNKAELNKIQYFGQFLI